jgi:ketosteroid isomerase-like protein
VPSREENLAVVQGFLDVNNEQGPEALLVRYGEFYAPDHEWHGGPAGRDMVGGDVVYRGSDGLRRFYEEIDNHVAAWHFTGTRVEALADDVFMAVARLHMTTREGGMDLEQEMAYVYWLEDGRIKRSEAFRSRDEALAGVRQSQHA